mmetsp:Transcript_8481/g.18007  ORF Transcript_8481/g.18007 Transcript_8481/m.18007 type:complete len:92 (-) Transcript_8481:203-478(-)
MVLPVEPLTAALDGSADSCGSTAFNEGNFVVAKEGAGIDCDRAVSLGPVDPNAASRSADAGDPAGDEDRDAADEGEGEGHLDAGRQGNGFF